MGHKWLKPCSLTNLPLVLETMYPLNWQLEQYYSKGSAAFRAVERRVSCDLKSDLTPLYPVPSPPPLMVTQAKGSLVLFCTPSFLAMPALRHGRCMARDLQHQRRNHMSKCLPFSSSAGPCSKYHERVPSKNSLRKGAVVTFSFLWP